MMSVKKLQGNTCRRKRGLGSKGKALSLLSKDEREAVRKFWRIEKETEKLERKKSRSLLRSGFS